MNISIFNESKFCVDPFKRHKNKIKKSLRYVTQSMIVKNPELNLQMHNKICISCRTKLAKDQDKPELSPSKSPLKSSDDESINSVHEDDAAIEYQVSELNQSLIALKETPIKKARLIHSKMYAKKKVQKMKVSVKRKLEVATGHPLSDSNSDHTENEILQQLKEKFNETTSRSEKLTILTILPKSWTKKKIIDEFKCSDYMSRQVKNLVKEKGVLSTPNIRIGKRLGSEHISTVIKFYHSEDVAREMPGMKDFVSVKGTDGIRERKQKFLILTNLKEAYQLFKEKYPHIKIGFSKFAELRPKECVLPGASGTHTVCVCTIHQNVKLMMVAISDTFKCNTEYSHDGPGNSTQIDEIDTNYICHYRHCLALLHCNPPQEKCFFRKCDYCPKTEKLIHLLNYVFDKKGVDEIEFNEWVSIDRSTIQTQILAVDEFIQTFLERLQNLMKHDFIAKIQMAFYQQLKENLIDGEFLIIGDFSENYSFIVQDSAQSFHWNNCQATLHPFVIYYRQNKELMHKSFVAISECNQHDIIAVHLFQTRLIEYLKLSHQIHKIYYFSDGCAAQYKNKKNFLNLTYHKDDFGFDAEWHFFATGHGKGPCDGIGGSVKRLASRSSLQRIGRELILDALALYNFSVKALPSISFTFTTIEEHEAHQRLLEKRLSYAKTIPGRFLNVF